MKEYIIGPNEAGQRFDKYLKKLLREAPSGFIYKMLRKKNIILNGGRAAGSEMLSCGDQVRVFFSDETLSKMQGQGLTGVGGDTAVPARPAAERKGTCKDDPEGLTIEAFRQRILYEDEHVLIIDKPAGVLSQPDASGLPSMVEYLTRYLLGSGSLDEDSLATFRPSVCNRLDRNTSGIILAGKSLAGLQALSQILKERRVHKYYLCLVCGTVTHSQNICGYLQKDQKRNKVIIQQSPGLGLSRIETGYRPLAAAEDATWLEVELITGRTHQIRAHLASIGHPLIGDAKYGDEKRNQFYRKRYGVNRQLLHAWRVTFDPADGILEPLSGRAFTAPVPADFPGQPGMPFMEQR